MKKFLKDESGQSTIEYAILALLIAIGVIVGLQFIGDQLNIKFFDIGTQVSGLPGG